MRDAKGASLGARDLESRAPSCESLTRALVLALVVMIESTIATTPEEKKIAEPAPPSTGGVGVFVIEAPPRPAPRPKELWRLEASGGFVVGAGLVPRAGAGFYGASSLTTPLAPVSASAAVHVLFGRDGASLLRGSLGLCPLVLARGPSVSELCASGALGVFFEGREGRLHADAAIDARTALRVLGPFTVAAGASLLIPMTRNGATSPLAGMPRPRTGGSRATRSSPRKRCRSRSKGPVTSRTRRSCASRSAELGRACRARRALEERPRAGRGPGGGAPRRRARAGAAREGSRERARPVRRGDQAPRARRVRARARGDRHRRLERAEDAKARAARFRAAWPNSAHAPRVEGLVGGSR